MIRYEIKGNGRAVILLHGWGQNMEMMRPIQDHLAKRYRVLNLDLPGFSAVMRRLRCGAV